MRQPIQVSPKVEPSQNEDDDERKGCDENHEAEMCKGRVGG